MATVNPYAAYSAGVAGVPWTNGQGQITGATIQNLLNLDLSTLATICNWTSLGICQPIIPNGYLTLPMIASGVLAFGNIAGTVTAAQLAPGAAVANIGYTPASVLSGAAGQLAYYAASGTGLSPLTTALPPAQGGTGTTTAVGSGSVVLASSNATTVNGQSCPLGGMCTIVASAGSITTGTTNVAGGTYNGLLYNNGGVLGNLASANNGVVGTNGSGLPSVSTTLPSGLTVPNPMITGALGGTSVVPNAALVNSTISGVALGSTLSTLTFGTHLTGTGYNGSGAITLATDAASANTASTIMARDASGNVSAGTVTAALTGHASLDLALTGGTMSGAIAMGGNAITGGGPITGSALTDTGLSTQGTTCNSAVGLISTSATGCPGTTQSVGTGGTGLTSGTSGGIPYFASGTTMASSAALGANALVLGGGAGAPPSTLGSLGTTTTVLHGNASGVPAFAAITLTTDVVAVLPLANGGTNANSAAGARTSTGLNIDNLCQNGDSAYTIAATCRQVQTSAALTAARTWTLPAAATVNAGQQIVVLDAAGGVTSSNTLTIQRAGSDTINGASSFSLTTAYSGQTLISDGVSKWSYSPSSSGGGSGTVTSITAGAGLAANGVGGASISTSGNLSLLDQTRRNLLLDQINMAKALGTAQRYIGELADGFADATGINAGASSGYTPSYTTKTVSAGAGTATTISGPNTISSTGSTAGTYRATIAQAGLSNVGNPYTLITVKAGSGNMTVGDLYVGPGGSTGSFGSTPTQCLFSGSSSITITASGTATCTAMYTVPASGGITIAGYVSTANQSYGALPTNYTSYYKAGGDDSATVTASGYTNDATNVYLVSQVQGAPYGNITLVSTSQTADATVTTARSGIILNASASPTWGTSDTMEVTCNGGTNWQLATPVSGGAVQAGSTQGGGILWEIPDTTCGASSTSFAARYKTLTNQARTIYGLSTTVH